MIKALLFIFSSGFLLHCLVYLLSLAAVLALRWKLNGDEARYDNGCCDSHHCFFISVLYTLQPGDLDCIGESHQPYAGLQSMFSFA
jgi:hypothetical protein